MKRIVILFDVSIRYETMRVWCRFVYCMCVCVFDVWGALSFSCSTGNWKKRAMLIERPVTDYFSQIRSKCFNTIWVPKISCSCHIQNVDMEEKTIIELKQMSIHQKRGKKPFSLRFIFFPVCLFSCRFGSGNSEILLASFEIPI